MLPMGDRAGRIATASSPLESPVRFLLALAILFGAFLPVQRLRADTIQVEIAEIHLPEGKPIFRVLPGGKEVGPFRTGELPGTDSGLVHALAAARGDLGELPGDADDRVVEEEDWEEGPRPADLDLEGSR